MRRINFFCFEFFSIVGRVFGLWKYDFFRCETIDKVPMVANPVAVLVGLILHKYIDHREGINEKVTIEED